MSKMSIDRKRYALSGLTMGTRWSALFYASEATDPAPIGAALAACVEQVDRQMSTWKPESELMRLNRAAVGATVPVPAELMEVLASACEIGRRSGGAFDIGVGDIVNAWGFGAGGADEAAIRAAIGHVRPRAYEVLDLDRDSLCVRKQGPVTLDLSGIAKGYAVDRMMAVLGRFGVADVLVSLDGELRARGRRADGRPWTIALERPDYRKRAALSILELADAALATSGDYRHWVDIGGRRFSHTVDPLQGRPLNGGLASVTVLAENCTTADAWATAFMVLGIESGTVLARELPLRVIFIEQADDDLRQSRVGWESSGKATPVLAVSRPAS